MTSYFDDSTVYVHEFGRQIDGEEMIILHPKTGNVLALPIDAIDILDLLSEGKTINEVKNIYQEKYHEVPDLQDFLALLEEEGFVSPRSSSNNVVEPASTLSTPIQSSKKYHFANFPQSVAQILFSKIALFIYFTIIGSALILTITDPSIIPGRNSLLFTKNIVFNQLILTLFNFFAIFLHEMAHLIAARSFGVSSRLSIGHRMWILVAETDMTGMWMVPRNQRYVAFLAGPLLDAVSASLLLIVYFLAHNQWIKLPYFILSLIHATVFMYMLTLVWQCYFFVRTDFYYVIAHTFNCKNLMGDTVQFVENSLSPLFRFFKYVDQGHISKNEMKIIKIYSLFWIFGRFSALFILFFVFIPLLYKYYLLIIPTIIRGYLQDPYTFIDALLISIVFTVVQVAGFALWIRSLSISGGGIWTRLTTQSHR